MNNNNTNKQNPTPWTQPIQQPQPTISAQPMQQQNFSTQPLQQTAMSQSLQHVFGIQPLPVLQAPQPAPMIAAQPNRMPDGKDALGRLVYGLPEDMFHRVLPSNLSLQMSKLMKRTNHYLFRGRHRSYRMILAQEIFKKTIELTELAAEMNKRRDNLTLIYKADAAHEALRIMWFTYYDAGFLGDYKNRSKLKEYNPQEALRIFAIINEHLDAVGRIIGATKKKAQAAKHSVPNRNV